MSLARYEDFLYAACLATTPSRSTAWRRQSDDVNRLAEWMQGKEEVRIQAPGPTSRSAWPGGRSIPCAGEHNMPDGEFFTGPVEDAVEGRGRRSRSRRATAAARCPGSSFRFEGGKVVDASAEQRRGVPDRDARHRRGRSPPWRARHRHELRHRDRHEGDPARREDRRHRPHGDRHELPGDRRHEQLSRALGHGLRPARRAARSPSTASSSSATGASWSSGAAGPAHRGGGG